MLLFSPSNIFAQGVYDFTTDCPDAIIDTDVYQKTKTNGILVLGSTEAVLEFTISKVLL